MSLNHKHNPDLHFIFPLQFYKNHFYFITVTHKLKNLSCGFILNNVKKCQCWIFFPKNVQIWSEWLQIRNGLPGFLPISQDSDPGCRKKQKPRIFFFFQSKRHKLWKKNQLREREKACLVCVSVCVCPRVTEREREREKQTERESEWLDDSNGLVYNRRRKRQTIRSRSKWVCIAFGPQFEFITQFPIWVLFSCFCFFVFVFFYMLCFLLRYWHNSFFFF